MEKQQEQFERLKQEVTAIRHARETLCPYTPALKRALMEHALDDSVVWDVLDEFGSRIGLELGLLASWFRAMLAQEETAQSAE